MIVKRKLLISLADILVYPSVDSAKERFDNHVRAKSMTWNVGSGIDNILREKINENPSFLIRNQTHSDPSTCMNIIIKPSQRLCCSRV